MRILDLGCGPGACSWYLAREGFAVFGIDGSPTAISQSQERLKDEGLWGDFLVGDFTELPWPSSYFDAVIDVVSMTCNKLTDSMKIIKEVYRVLRPGGRFFSIAFKNGCYGDGLGNQVGPHTFKDIMEGPLAGQGIIRFSPEAEVRQLYGIFHELNLEYSIRSIDNMAYEVAHWIISCQKPSEK